MDVAVKGAAQKDLQQGVDLAQAATISPTSGFFFTSPFRSLSTQGCFARITMPAVDGDDLHGQFQQAIQQAFAQARKAGIKDPLLCGAIPFDTRQPSSLFIPQQTQWFDRESLLTSLAPAAGQIPEIVRQPNCQRSRSLCRWLAMPYRQLVVIDWIRWCSPACWILKPASR